MTDTWRAISPDALVIVDHQASFTTSPWLVVRRNMREVIKKFLDSPRFNLSSDSHAFISSKYTNHITEQILMLKLRTTNRRELNQNQIEMIVYILVVVNTSLKHQIISSLVNTGSSLASDK